MCCLAFKRMYVSLSCKDVYFTEEELSSRVGTGNVAYIHQVNLVNVVGKFRNNGEIHRSLWSVMKLMHRLLTDKVLDFLQSYSFLSAFCATYLLVGNQLRGCSMRI